jgi:SAM-dependent methyltransferase
VLDVGGVGARAGRPWTPVDEPGPSGLDAATNAADGVALLLALPRLPDLDGVFAELRRVLRPGGTLVVVVPSAGWRSSPAHRCWRHRSALDRAGWLLAAADFAVLSDDRRTFTVPLPGAEAALALADALPAAGLWPPELPDDVRARARDRLVRRAGGDLPLPLRRLVARR